MSRYLRYCTGMALVGVAAGLAGAQDLRIVHQQSGVAIDAIQRGDTARAKAAFAQFNTSARSYVMANGRSWKIEYLAGSLDCAFPETKATGAQFLNDILQNNRTLNRDGDAELRRQLAVCTAEANSAPLAAAPSLPPNLTEVSTHFQAPGVHGDMKGGGSYTVDQESSTAVSPIASSELMARLVSVNEPAKALHAALGRVPAGSKGAVAENFAVTTAQGTATQAVGIGRCLKSYAEPLKSEFKINTSSYMVTAYTVTQEGEVYSYARRLHGLQLPQGVIAYSVPEDMSLTSAASASACGSAAHELVHLLIKQSFPGAPAWLEEGLASEVAIASPSPDRLRVGWSWRDDRLRNNLGLRPPVAQMLGMPLSSFNSNSFIGMRSAEATQAMAAVFIRYLDAKGNLPDVYFAVRDQHISSDLSGFKSYEAILEEVLRLPVASIDDDFEQWFSSETLKHPGAPPAEFSGGGVQGQYMNAAPRPRECVAPNSPKQQAVPCEPATGNEAVPNAAAPSKQ